MSIYCTWNVNPPFLTYLRDVRIPFFFIAEHFVSEAPYFVERFSGSVLWSFFPTALPSFWGENIWMSVSDSKLHTSFPWKGTKKNKQNPNTHTDRFRHSIAHLKGIVVTLINLMSNIPAGNLKSASFLSLLKGAALIKHAKHFKSALQWFFYKHTQNKLHTGKFVWINAKNANFPLPVIIPPLMSWE